MKQHKRFFQFFACLTFTFISLSNVPASTLSPTKSGSVLASDLPSSQDLFQSGLQLYKTGQLQEAIALWQKALTLTEDPQRQAETQGNLAIAYYEASQYDKALEANQIAIDLLTQLEKISTVGQVYSNLGNVYEALGQYEQAISAHEKSIDIARSTQQRRAEGIGIGNLGYVYSVQGNQVAAIEAYNDSLIIARAVGNHTGESTQLLNMGIAYHELEKIHLAEQYYLDSLAITQKIEEAQPTEARVLLNLGMVVAERGDYDSAIEYIEQSLAIAETLQEPNLSARAFNNLGHTLLATDRLAEAETQLRRAITHLNDLRQDLDDTFNVSTFDTQIYTYNLLAQVLVKSDQYEAALEISEAGRARAFSDLLQKRSTPLYVSDHESFVSSAPSIEEIKRLARQTNTTLVEYVLVPEEAFRVQGRQRGQTSEIHIWVVSPSGKIDFHSQPIDPQNQPLIDLVRQVRDSVGSRNRGFVPIGDYTSKADTIANLNQLYQILVDPIQDYLPTDPEAEIVFIPQEELFLVPFPALVRNDGDFLIEHHTVRTAPSIQTLALARSRHIQLNNASQPPRQPPLIVGNPNMPEVWGSQLGSIGQLPPLPGAKQEAIAISNLFGVAPLIEQFASEKVIRSQIEDTSIIHLATHGLLDYGNPQETGIKDIPGAIALAPALVSTRTLDPKEDGLLTSAEILSLDLQADLAVLSACDTGLGDITGDGVIGLSRSLIAAGVPSVVVSLWSIPDAPTALLMTEFYVQMQEGKNKAQSLRQAMLMTMSSHPDPSNWAAFTLIGEAESVIEQRKIESEETPQ